MSEPSTPKRGRGRGHGRGRGRKGNSSQQPSPPTTPKARASQQGSRSGTPRSQKNTPRNRKPIFEEYLSLEDMQKGLEEGRFLKGKLRINSRNFEDCYIPGGRAFARDISIPSFAARNRALDGDIVAVEVQPRHTWRVMHSEAREAGIDIPHDHMQTLEQALAELNLAPSQNKGRNQRNRVDQSAAARMVAAGVGESLPNSPAKSPAKSVTDRVNGVPDEFLQPVAKVVGILRRDPERQFVGYVRPFNERKCLFVPRDARVPRLMLRKNGIPEAILNDLPAHEYTLTLATMMHWETDSKYAQGTFLKELGSSGAVDAETTAILREYNIPGLDFDDDVIACLPPVDDQHPFDIPEEEYAKRRDLRNHRIFSIDPPTARDLDDALHCTKLANGNYEIGVHIADVSHFVLPNTPLDTEAQRRATTTYMVQKAYHMLPRMLCEQLCSLTANEDRFAFSVIWEVDPEGHKKSEWFGKSVIRSCGKLAYGHAQQFIENPDKEWDADSFPELYNHAPEDVKADILALHSIAQHLRRRRFGSGALRINKTKLAFRLDEEQNPQECFAYVQKEANQLVEEFMLLANQSVAEQIHRRFPQMALLRRHPAPLEQRLKEVSERYRNYGLEMRTESSGAVAQSIRQYEAKEQDKAKVQVLQVLMTTPMQLAQYFATGDPDLDEDDYRHYALSMPYYTHFTSPIRRYADVIVHRLLQASLTHEELGYNHDDVAEIALTCNERKEAAKRAQEASSKLFMSVYVHQNGPFVEEAVVYRVLDRSFDMLVVRLGVEVRMYVDKLGVEAHSYDESTQVLRLTYKTPQGEIVKNIEFLGKHMVTLSTELVKGQYQFKPELMLDAAPEVERQDSANVAEICDLDMHDED
eukprot:TRINITY_DN6757_c1_g1_i1.p1 TRINITY_DN6757_c1_g1~~TRINITY_DN6757_c1_g1_i1.p1  ORF type:complete len:868 (+),score=207.09 TRINITY_DN6757_c1_g1_i1:101-2704(+)